MIQRQAVPIRLPPFFWLGDPPGPVPPAGGVSLESFLLGMPGRDVAGSAPDKPGADPGEP